METKIMELIEKTLDVPAGSVSKDSCMSDFEEWDSLAHVMIIGNLEEQLGIVIPLEEAVEITKVSEILEKAGL